MATQGKLEHIEPGLHNFDFSFSASLGLGQYYLSVGVAQVKDEIEIHDYEMLDFVHDAVHFVASSLADFNGIVDMKSKLLSIEPAK